MGPGRKPRRPGFSKRGSYNSVIIEESNLQGRVIMMNGKYMYLTFGLKVWSLRKGKEPALTFI